MKLSRPNIISTILETLERERRTTRVLNRCEHWLKKKNEGWGNNAELLEIIANIDQHRYIEQIKSRMIGNNVNEKIPSIMTFDCLAKIDYEQFLFLYDKALSDFNTRVRSVTANKLYLLVPKDMNRYMSYYENIMKEDSRHVKTRAARTIGWLAPHNFDLYLKLLNKCLLSTDRHISIAVARSIGRLPALDFKKICRII